MISELDKIEETIKAEVKNADNTTSRANLQDAWKKFAATNADSQELFHESLELLAGLAFRGLAKGPTDPDARLCRVADALINTCAQYTFRSPSLLSPLVRSVSPRPCHG